MLVMDACGPRVPIGGGAWFEKGFFKAYRAGALYARRLARLMVNVGLSEALIVTVGFRPGAEQAEILRSLDQVRRCARLLDGSLRGNVEGGVGGGGLIEVPGWDAFEELRVWKSPRSSPRPQCACVA
jgi:hypothetical protein